jgi:hypothetical protein
LRTTACLYNRANEACNAPPAAMHASWLLAALVGTGVLNVVLLRKLLYLVPEYEVTVSMLLNVAYVATLLPLWQLVGEKHGLQMRVPLRFFVYTALLDGVGSFLALVGGASTSGALQLLVAKIDIPLSLLVTAAMLAAVLRVRYRWTHLVGVAFVVAGVLVAVMPPLVRGGDANNSVAGVLLYTLSVVPLTASELYKEVVMKRYQMDVLYTNAWCTPWQLLVSLALLPAMALPGVSALRAGDLADNLRDGTWCLVVARTDVCWHARWLLLVFFVANLVYNLVAVAALRHCSAVVASVASAALIPVGALVFSLRAVMGAHAVPLDGGVIASLVLVLAGIALYRVYSEHGETACASDEYERAHALASDA